ncbi:MAG TPA: radical SAM protein [Bryobacteraceae bacterium]|jgi:MoaA/NifB/PqqE/SkfB family radical SAM enzyme|nr:radical SAM protein [Bryobacteraceae bacterium]
MLSTIIPVGWSPIGDDDLVATPAVALPQILKKLVIEDVTSPLAIARHIRPDGAIPLRMGLLYQTEGLLFTEAPARYLPEQDAVLIARSDMAELVARIRSLGQQGLVPAHPLRGGVGDIISLRRVSETVCQALNIESESAAWTSDAVGFLSRTRDVDAFSLGPPDALVFHDDSAPETLTLTLEAATACNFRCGFCYGRHIDQGVLKWDHFTAVLDGLHGLRAVEFTGEGEPLMNKRIVDMLLECKKRGLWVHLTTNGSLLNRELAERIVDLGIDSLAVSIESLKPERFARLRPGGDLRIVLDALRMIHRVRRDRQSALQLRLWVTLLRETLDELDDMDDLAQELEIEFVEFQSLNPMTAYSRFYDAYLRGNMLTSEDLREVLETMQLSPTIHQSLESLIKVYDGRRCDIFMSAAMIYWQGEATPCRLLKVPQHPSVGNMIGRDYVDLWNGEPFKRFRFALQHGVILNSCQNCPFVASAKIHLPAAG